MATKKQAESKLKGFNEKAVLEYNPKSNPAFVVLKTTEDKPWPNSGTSDHRRIEQEPTETKATFWDNVVLSPECFLGE